MWWRENTAIMFHRSYAYKVKSLPIMLKRVNYDIIDKNIIVTYNVRNDIIAAMFYIIEAYNVKLTNYNVKNVGL